ncbi:hypothetical protein DWV00_08730 [Trinickia dinghuensis]|uniref:Uncharacterized protein n=1 Tax=Trinickia dinghuensis TaxID=2291023 RepID=A0A3D8K228_9BURK|nr:hypothetical protein DWV00_08730 [Trinickia dinghuensis]
MNDGTTRVEVSLPAVEAADLAVRAARAGVSTPVLLGYHVLRSVYGSLHPLVAEFETRPKLGRDGQIRDEKE